jgi:hypothetical protein
VLEEESVSVSVALSKVIRVTRRENVGDIDITLNGLRMKKLTVLDM